MPGSDAAMPRAKDPPLNAAMQHAEDPPVKCTTIPASAVKPRARRTPIRVGVSTTTTKQPATPRARRTPVKVGASTTTTKRPAKAKRALFGIGASATLEPQPTTTTKPPARAKAKRALIGLGASPTLEPQPTTTTKRPAKANVKRALIGCGVSHKAANKSFNGAVPEPAIQVKQRHQNLDTESSTQVPWFEDPHLDAYQTYQEFFGRRKYDYGDHP